MKTIVEVLKDARKLLAKGWTQGNVARDENGYSVGVFAPHAVCFCMTGAMILASCGADDITGKCARDIVRHEIGKFSIPEWNDEEGRTQAEVLDVMDRAIKRAS